MSIFGKMKHAAHHVAHKAEHAGKKVEHTAKKAGDAVGDAAKKVGDTVASLDPKHIADEVKDEILKSLKTVENEALSAIKKAESEAKAVVEKEFDKVMDAFRTRAAKEVLSDLVDVIRAISPDEITVQLGPVQLAVGDVENKVEHFVKWSKNPPHNRETYIAFVKDVTPESLTLIEGIGLGLLVQSDDAKLEIQETWNGESILQNIDHILAKAGIN